MTAGLYRKRNSIFSRSGGRSEALGQPDFSTRVPVVELDLLNAVDHFRCAHGARDLRNAADGVADAGGGSDEEHAGMRAAAPHMSLGQYQKIVILRQEDASERDRRRQLRGVQSSKRCLMRRGSDIHTTASEALENAPVHALVGVELKGHASRLWLRDTWTARIAFLKRGDRRQRFGPLGPDHVLVIVKVGQRRVNLPQREMRMCLDYLIRRHPLAFHLARDLTHLDARSANDGAGTRGVDMGLLWEREGFHDCGSFHSTFWLVFPPRNQVHISPAAPSCAEEA